MLHTQLNLMLQIVLISMFNIKFWRVYSREMRTRAGEWRQKCTECLETAYFIKLCSNENGKRVVRGLRHFWAISLFCREKESLCAFVYYKMLKFFSHSLNNEFHSGNYSSNCKNQGLWREKKKKKNHEDEWEILRAASALTDALTEHKGTGAMREGMQILGENHTSKVSACKEVVCRTLKQPGFRDLLHVVRCKSICSFRLCS